MKQKLFLLLFGLFFLNSCTTIFGPQQYHPTRNALQYIPFGSWMNIDYQVNGISTIYGGELIAVEKDTILILGLKSVLHRIAKTDINQANLLLHQSDLNRYGRMSSIGFYSTIPLNGFFAIFTGPAWIIVGITSGMRAAKGGYYLDTREYTWSEIAVYARFPKGIPPAIDVTTLKAKEFGERYKVK